MSIVEEQPILGVLRPSRVRTIDVGQVLAVAVPSVAAAVFYAVFIARTAVTFAGHTWFSLFDDAMISMRYGANLAHGHGLVYNVGTHPVEGYTNFLWTLYMAFIHLLPISASKTSLAIELTGVALLIGCGLLVARIARLLVPDSRLVVVLSVTGTLFFYPLVFWTLRGMEVGLATLLVLSLVLSALRLAQEYSPRRLAPIAGLACVAVLLRDDLLLPSMVVIAFALAFSPRGSRRRTALLLFGPLAAVIGAHEAFRLAYYGEALPNTYYLKIAGTGTGSRVHRGLLVVASTFVLTLSAPIALAAGTLWGRIRARDGRMLLLAAVVLSLFAYTVYVGGDAWENFRFADRFLTPAAPLLMILSAVGLHRFALSGRRALKLPAVSATLLVAAILSLLPAGTILYWLSDSGWGNGLGSVAARVAVPVVAGGLLLSLLLAARRGSRATKVTPVRVTLLIGFGLIVLLPNARTYRDWVKSNATSVQDQNGAMELGLGLRALTRPSDSIAVSSAGAIAYFSGRPVVDLLGVTDARIAHEPSKTARFLPGHTKWDYAYSLGVLRPQIVYGLYGSGIAGVTGRLLGTLGYRPALVQIRGGTGDAATQHIVVYLSPAMATRAAHDRRGAAPGAPARFWL